MRTCGASRRAASALLLGTLGVVSWSSGEAADLIKGQMVYFKHCAGCHGPRGFSVVPQAPSFAKGERLDQADFILLNTIKTGRAAMPPFIGIINDREILDVLAYIRTLR